eukprot:COSAG04_NODE_23622_length_335_cov_0.855932_1_plen_49_part_10
MADGIPEGLPPCGALQPERSVPVAAQEESEPEPEPQPHLEPEPEPELEP